MSVWEKTPKTPQKINAFEHRKKLQKSEDSRRSD